MTVKMIVAVDRNNAIGWQDGRLPWKIPADLQRFKALTTGKTVLMGRKTFESLGRPNGLPNRQNVILTTDSAKRTKYGEHPVWFKDGDDSLRTFVQVHQACLGCDPGDLWIIGGATIYDQALAHQLVDEIHLTLVETDSGADVTLSFDLSNPEQFIVRQRQHGIEWYLADTESHITDGELALPYHFLTLKRHR